MDLGATLVHPRKPSCPTCPWSDLRAARQVGDPERYPVKSRKLKRSERENWWLWLVWREQVWLQQMPDKGVWAGLWTLPLLDGDEAVFALLGSALNARVERQPRMKHVLTHLDWWLHARRVVLDDAEVAYLEPALRRRPLQGDGCRSPTWPTGAAGPAAPPAGGLRGAVALGGRCGGRQPR